MVLGYKPRITCKWCTTMHQHECGISAVSSFHLTCIALVLHEFGIHVFTMFSPGWVSTSTNAKKDKNIEIITNTSFQFRDYNLQAPAVASAFAFHLFIWTDTSNKSTPTPTKHTQIMHLNSLAISCPILIKVLRLAKVAVAFAFV